ncbi:MAG: hypothetical protein HYX41_04465, partial [Bdellovibrio sp.]|nr:hypothetical protein [Bdellovibrio sp.]
AKRTAAKQRVQARLQAKAAENASASGETTQNLEARIAKLQASLDNSGNYTAERKQALQGAIDSLKQKLQQKAEPVPPKTQSEAENKKPEAAKKQPADPLMADLVSEVDSHNERVNEGNKALKSKIGGPSFTAQLNPPPPPPPPPVGQGKDLSDNKAEEYADFLLGKTDYLKDVLKAPQSLSNKNAFLEYIENQNKYDPEKKKAELKKLFKAEPALRPFIDQALKDHPNWLQKRRQNNEP